MVTLWEFSGRHLGVKYVKAVFPSPVLVQYRARFISLSSFRFVQSKDRLPTCCHLQSFVAIVPVLLGYVNKYKASFFQELDGMRGDRKFCPVSLKSPSLFPFSHPLTFTSYSVFPSSSFSSVHLIHSYYSRA